ncbi:MAG: dihydroorotate dehydrogenase-like protein [Phycisphaerae bacterium]|nr:dihydroorotate dehydrogenase-like protein [Phycisphaerae bacterium]
MADLKTTYLGLELKNPIVVGACDLTADIEKIKQIEAAGAGALVIKSLFEEQIQLESYKMEQSLHENDNLHAEMTSIFPELEHAGPAEHLMWVKKAKEAVSIPVIASLNAVSTDVWLDYAKQLADTGVDGLELNFYAVPSLDNQSAAHIEDAQIAILQAIKSSVSIPVSVKLSPFYTNPAHVITRFDQAGADGVVLFNQLFQSDIDIHKEKQTFAMSLSGEKDHRLPLRFVGLLHGNMTGTLCASTGILNGTGIIQMLLAGAGSVQVVSALYRDKIKAIETMLNDLEQWMDAKGYASLHDFVGKLSRKNLKDPWAYQRSQYVRALLRENPMG